MSFVFMEKPSVLRRGPRVQTTLAVGADGTSRHYITDLRTAGQTFCTDCADHEACAGGWPCGLVQELHVDNAVSCECAICVRVMTCEYAYL